MSRHWFKIDFLQNSLESETLVPNMARLKPSIPGSASILILFFSFFCVGCAVKPSLIPEMKMMQLAALLQTLDTSIPKDEALQLSKDIFHKTQKLTQQFELTSPPLWHNFLVNVGLRGKGLCYHWSDALYRHLSRKQYPSFEFHLMGANIGEYFFEHNVLVVAAKGGRVENGIIIDPWRDSGKLYFSKVDEDKKYKWKQRKNREFQKTQQGIKMANISCL